MHQRFWTSITKAVITAMALGVFLAGVNHAGNVAAQTEPTTQQPKKTTEPVFRVPKEANLESEKVQANPVDSLTLQTDDKDAPDVQRVADTRNLPGAGTNVPKSIPAVLPSAETPPPTIPSKAVRTPHPLDQAIDVAQVALDQMREEVNDYTAILAKREAINGVISAPSYMNIKVRCPRKLADGTTTPFSLYMKFIRPKDSAGREVIWIDGTNQNKLAVHEGSGLLRLRTIHLDPDGALAMRGQKYPIYDAGIENLIIKLIEKADRDRAAGPCKVTFREGAKINKRPCALIELVHDEERAPYEFHKAQVFIDEELNLPVRFAAYDWPASPGATPTLLEEYTYYNLKVNVGLTDLDFSRENPAYKFPN